MRTAVSCYRRAADAIASSQFTPELAASLKEELARVFNRGFWDGWYQGAVIGEWSAVYGSQATRRRVYCGKVTNWFDRIGVAEIAVEATELRKGDTLLATGPTTGVVELTVEDMRVDFNPVELTPKGVRCSLAVDTALCPDGRLRRGDKIFVWK